MPLLNQRTSGGSSQGAIVRLEPIDHPHLESTYHASESDARGAAEVQSRNFGGFKYNLHKDGKPIQLSAVAHGPEMTERASAYNKSRKRK
jgi:hypothetical protein